MTNIDTILKSINEKFNQLEERLKLLEQSENSGNNAASSLKNAVRVTGTLETPKINKVDLSSFKLVEVYNDIPSLLANSAIEVTLTAESYRGNTNGEIFLENSGNGNYWVIAKDDIIYWLLPKDNLKINIHKLKTIKSLFRFQGEKPEDAVEFTLVKPAKVSLMPNGQQWKLEKPGVLYLGNGTQSTKLQSELELTNQERERLQSLLGQLRQEHQQLQPQLEQFHQEYQQLQSQLKQSRQKSQRFESQLQQLVEQVSHLHGQLEHQFEQFTQERSLLQSQFLERQDALYRANEERFLQIQLQMEFLIRTEVAKIEQNLKTNYKNDSLENGDDTLLQREMSVGYQDILTTASASQNTPVNQHLSEQVDWEAFDRADVSEIATQQESQISIDDLLEDAASNPEPALATDTDYRETSKPNSVPWQTAQPIHTLTSHTEAVRAIAISPDSRILASASFDKTIKIWNLKTGEAIGSLTGRPKLNAIAISPDGQMIIGGGDDSTIKIWNLATAESTALTGHSDWIRCIAISPDGQTLASGSRDETIKIWNLQTRSVLRTLTGHDGTVLAIAISPDRQTLASGSADKTIKLWNLQTGQLLHTLTQHSDLIWSVTISPDGQTLASGSRDNTIKLWNMNTGELQNIFVGHSEGVWSVTISPDGQTLASGSGDKTIKLWKLVTGELLCTLTEHSNEVYGVAFSPADNSLSQGIDSMLVSSSRDNTIKIWKN
jgi:WD40 repeat protein